MVAFLLPVALAADVSQTIANPEHRLAVQRCDSALSRKVNGEMTEVKVDEYRRVGQRISLKGVINVQQRPISRPGEMTPAHIVNVRYSYECRLDGRRQPRVKVSRLD